MPYAVKHYPFENKEWFKTNYPADFISEYIAQVRAWFYYMHVLGVLVFNKAPYKNVVVTGNILAADGTKMSKSKKNFPNPNLVIDKYGADSLRFFLMSASLMRAEDMNFNEKALGDIHRKVIMLLGNINKFYNLFSEDNKVLKSYSTEHVLDKWIISKLHYLIKTVTKALDDYNTTITCKEITSFISDLSQWYVRRSRDRFKKGDKKAVKTLAYVLSNLIKVMAPITPFVSEEVYQSLPNQLESVHLERWPKYNDKLINKALNKKMELAREIVSLALDNREKARIPVRQALSKIIVNGPKLGKDYLKLISDEVNVKKAILKEGKKLSVKLDTKITRELLMEGISRDLTRKINQFRKELKLTTKNRITLYLETNNELVKTSFSKYKEEVMNAIQADEVKFNKPKKGSKKEITVNKAKVKVGISKT
jgi:isoleucyl-tRNA synthetase